MSVLNESSAASLPQPLGPGDSPTFASETLTGDLAVAGSATVGVDLAVTGVLSAGSLVVPIETTGHINLTDTSGQIVTSSASGAPTTISVPTMGQATTLTIGDPGVASTTLLTADPPGGNQLVQGNWTSTGNLASQASVFAGASITAQSQLVSQATSAQLLLSSVAAHSTTISAPTPTVTQTVTLPDLGASTGSIIVSSRAGSVSQTIASPLTVGLGSGVALTTQSTALIHGFLNVDNSIFVAATSSQLTLSNGAAHSTTISAPTPATTQTVTLPDLGASTGSFIVSSVTGGSPSQSISSQLVVTDTVSTASIDAAGNIRSAGRFLSTIASPGPQLVAYSGGAFPYSLAMTLPGGPRTVTFPDPSSATASVILSSVVGGTQSIGGSVSVGTSISSGTTITAGTSLTATTTVITPSLTLPSPSVPLTVYKEGTFTPTVAFGGAFVGGVASATGSYTRVGNMVTAYVFVIVNTVGSSVGPAFINSLPYAVAGGVSNGVAGMAIGITHTATYTQPMFSITGGGNSIDLWEYSPVAGVAGSTVIALTNASFNAGTQFRLTATYSTTAPA